MKKRYWLTLFGYVFWASAVKADSAPTSFALLNDTNKLSSDWQARSVAQFNSEPEKQGLSIAGNTRLFSQTTKLPPVGIAAKLQEAEVSAKNFTTVPMNSLGVETTANYLSEAPIKANNNAIAQNYLVPDTLGQVNSVSQLKDVNPNDWAYEALRSLSERYNCMSGFSDGTFRGEKSLSRYEFAAGLNSCLQQIESLIASSETVAPEDLQTVERLSQDFEAELAAISGRVDELESRVATLEDDQFSTTTILNGEVVFAIADAWGGNPPGGCDSLDLNLPNGETANAVNCGLQGDVANPGSTAEEPDTETVFAYLTRLGLQASFTGQDRLRMYLTTGNFNDGGFTNPEAFNTYSPRFSYQAGLDSDVFLDILEYRFPAFNNRVAFYASTFGFSLSNVLTANSPFFDIGRGSVSRFGQLNPIFRIGGAMDAGVGIDWLIAEPIRFQATYGTRDSGDPEAGFFGADFSAFGAQLLLQPTENIVTGLTYVNAYSNDGSLGTYTGSVNAETNGLWSGGRLPATQGELGGAFPGIGVDLGDFPAQINAVGGTFQWNLTSQLNFGASAAYTFANYLDEIPEFNLDGQIPGIQEVAGEKPFANTLTYQFSLGLSDPFGREGDVFGFVFGMPPKLVDAGPVAPGQTVPFSEQVINNEDPVAITDNDPRQFLTENEVFGDPDNDFLVQEGALDQFGREDEATSLHFEFFYRFTVNDNISVTPGFFFVTNPGHIAQNDTIYVGTMRTTFRF